MDDQGTQKQEEQAPESNRPQAGEDTASAEFTRCVKEREEYLQGWQRARADLSNYKKDEARRVEDVVRFSNEMLLRDLIPVLDSLDLGITVLENDTVAQKGISLVRIQLEEVVRKYGLERMLSGLRASFDPAKQEAVLEVASDEPAGTVVEEINRGYTLHGKVVRPGRVKIAKGRES